MIDITLQNFEAELIVASQSQPVLLDIWAPWCGPCRTLGPVLEKLETAYAGRFKLAKLNSDEVPQIATQLSEMFGVRSIPFCVMFAGGQPVDGFVGAIPEAQIREFLDKHVPPGEELAVDEAPNDDLMAEDDLETALGKLAQAVQADPANDAARFDYVKALLELGLVAEAREAFAPVAAKAADTLVPSPRLAALAIWLTAFEAAASADTAALQAAIGADKRDFESRFALAQSHLAGQRFTEAMDELLEIIMRDKTWMDQAARKTYVAILELLAKPAPKPATEAKGGALELSAKATVVQSDPLIDQYRRKLSMALF